MQEPTTPGNPPDDSRPAAEAGARASLGLLLAEAAALANQLRKFKNLVPGEDNSPPGGWSILQTLGRLGPQTVPDIARARSLSRQNIQIQINRLQSQGYVAVIPNPAHKRSGLVELTDRGRRLQASVMEREATSLEGLLPHVSQSSLAPAAELLRQLRQLLAGKELPPLETVEEHPALTPARRPRRHSRRRKPAPTKADLPPDREPIEPDEDEFPVNLL